MKAVTHESPDGTEGPTKMLVEFLGEDGVVRMTLVMAGPDQVDEIVAALTECRDFVWKKEV